MGGYAHGWRNLYIVIGPCTVLVFYPKPVCEIPSCCWQNLHAGYCTDWPFGWQAFADQHLCALQGIAISFNGVCRCLDFFRVEGNQNKKYKDTPANDGALIHLCTCFCVGKSK